MSKTLKTILIISGIGIVIIVLVSILRKKKEVEAKLTSPTIATPESIKELPPALSLQVLPTFMQDYLEKATEIKPPTREQLLQDYVNRIIGGERPGLINKEVYNLLPTSIQQFYGAVSPTYPESPYALIGQMATVERGTI